MTRGMRMLILVFIFIGVIVAMMDCAKKTMRKKKAHPEEGGQENGLFLPAPSDPAIPAGALRVVMD